MSILAKVRRLIHRDRTPSRDQVGKLLEQHKQAAEREAANRDTQGGGTHGGQAQS